MPNLLHLRGPGGERTTIDLNEHDDTVLRTMTGALVEFADGSGSAAMVYERGETRATGWTVQGALRLAELLPPASSGLAGAIHASLVRPPPQSRHSR